MDRPGILQDLLFLRQKMGYAMAFLGNSRVEEALQITRPPRGVLNSRLQQKIAQVGARPAPKALLGPRGGLPKDKSSLILLARSLGVSDDGTVAVLNQRCREALGTLKTTETRPAERPLETVPVDQQDGGGPQPSASSGINSSDSVAHSTVEQRLQALMTENAQLRQRFQPAPPSVVDLTVGDQVILVPDLEMYGIPADDAVSVVSSARDDL